jgi:hypothetical protein
MEFAGVDRADESVRDWEADAVLSHEDCCITEIDCDSLASDCDSVGGQTTVASIEPGEKLAGKFAESKLTQCRDIYAVGIGD